MMEWPLIVAVGIVLLFGGIIVIQYRKNRKRKGEISQVEHETELRVAALAAEVKARENHGLPPIEAESVVSEAKDAVTSDS